MPPSNLPPNCSRSPRAAELPIANEGELSLFERVLLATDGTVTDLIALYAGEGIRVRKLEQTLDRREAPSELCCPEPMQLLNRRILLAGRTRNYLYAESQFVFDRFAPVVQEQLLKTDTPIGLLWREARLETYREVIAKSIGTCAVIAPYFELPSDGAFVARTYVVHHRGLPLGTITEKWPAGLFVDRPSVR
jgi:chorismate-pyruvate lyase